MPSKSAYLLDRLKSSHIIGEFTIKNSDYLVITDETFQFSSSSDNIDKKLQTELKVSNYKVVCHFVISGKSCAIVEIKNTESTSNIPKLLTERELQIVYLVAQGQQNKQIANQLRISEWTVSTHLRRIFAKLNVDSRAAMVFRCSDLLQNFQELQT
ncbi:response regulator transcription factor [Acaryochloris sp. CCMEE 5410]|nr:response regulator transcription factor [Acaryochloris sp. CCMEE 5410]